MHATDLSHLTVATIDQIPFDARCILQLHSAIVQIDINQLMTKSNQKYTVSGNALTTMSNPSYKTTAQTQATLNTPNIQMFSNPCQIP